jgi:hypothetical protein
MIAEIRDYFRNIIASVDSDLREFEQPIDTGNLPDTKLETSYSILIGSTSVDRIDVSTSNTTEVIVVIYKNGYNNEIENYDSTYCKALDILRESINQQNITQSYMLKAINTSGVNVEPLETNDNAYKFSIQFTVNTNF